MIRNDVGCIVVAENSEVMGIVTKGDILKNSLLRLRDPVSANIGSIMARPFITI
jgi:CBS domain-containing protein